MTAAVSNMPNTGPYVTAWAIAGVLVAALIACAVHAVSGKGTQR